MRLCHGINVLFMQILKGLLLFVEMDSMKV